MHPAASRDSSLAGGLALAVTAFACFSLMDVVIKMLAGRYAVPQVIFFQALFSLVPILGYAALTGGVLNNIRTRRPRMHLLRAVLGVVGSFCAVYAYSRMPIADAYALGFSAPLFITALSVPILKEVVGWRRWTAVAVGFAGVLVMLRPGAGIVDVGAFAALGGALCYSINMLLSRMMRGTERAVSFAFYGTCASLTVTATLLPAVWITPAWGDLGMAAVAGGLGGSAVIMLLNAFRAAPAAVVAPFQYTQMVWGITYGYLFFGDRPDGWLLLGAAIVIGSGLYILYRETVVGRGVAGKGVVGKGPVPAVVVAPAGVGKAEEPGYAVGTSPLVEPSSR